MKLLITHHWNWFLRVELHHDRSAYEAGALLLSYGGMEKLAALVGFAPTPNALTGRWTTVIPRAIWKGVLCNRGRSRERERAEGAVD